MSRSLRSCLAPLALLGLLACGPKAPPEPAAQGAAEATSAVAPGSAAAPGLPPAPSTPRFGTLSFAETWPVETTLDEPGFPEAFEVWPALMAGATETLDISEFYIANRPEGPSRLDATLAAVEAAAARGVAVRIIGDAKFYKTYPELLDALGAQDNIEVRIYDMDPLTGGVQHAKYFLVDGRTAWVGSQNMDWRSLEHICELGYQLDSPDITAVYQDIFDLDWALAGGASLEEARASLSPHKPASLPVSYEGGAVVVRPVGSPVELLPDEALWDLPLLLEAINGAEEHIRVQVMSYAVKAYDKSEWHELDDALRAAAGRGVKVELLMANWSKKGSKLEEAQSLQRVDNITVKFANIPEWSGGFEPFSRVIHSKLMVVDDDWAWVGTSNWSKDYFHGSRNLGLVMEGKAAAEDLQRYSDRIWDSEYTEVVDPDKTDYAPPKTR